MYKNFLEETILSGQIKNIYLNEFPNNVLISQNDQFILSIESKSFIGKIIVKDKAVGVYYNLPINDDSKNLIIDWGDNTYTQIFSIICKDNNRYKQLSNLLKGDAYYDENKQEYKIFNGKQFITCDYNNILPNMLSLNHQVLKQKKYNSYEYKLIDIGNENSILHQYSAIGIYYIKIKGGLTGFCNIKNSNSMFYSESIYLEQILSWGSQTNWNTLNNAFNSCEYLKSIPSTQMPNINDATSCFYNCSLLNIPHISNLLPHALIYSTSMFEGCSEIKGDLSYLNMPPYNTSISKMFYNTNITVSPNKYSSKEYYNKENAIPENCEII